MKKDLIKAVSFLLAMTFVFSFVTACSKDGAGDEQSTAAGESVTEAGEVLSDEDVVPAGVSEEYSEGGLQGDYSVVSGEETATTTKANLAPGTSTTNKVERVTLATTKAGETTTARRGIVAGTTAANGGVSTTKVVPGTTTTTTTKPAAAGAETTTVAETTIKSAYSDSDWKASDSTIVKPQETYYDKYVKDVFASGSYTITGYRDASEMESDEFQMKLSDSNGRIKITIYCSDGKICGDCGAVFRILIADEEMYFMQPVLRKYYVIANGSNGIEELDEIDEFISGFQKVFDDESGLVYIGTESTANGVTVEKYRSGDALLYLYFSGGKLVGFEQASNNNGKVDTTMINVTLTKGVADAKVFKTPMELGYSAVDEAAIKDLF